jgi:hypothetical protein
MREMKGWLAGALIFFSVNLMGQTNQNYKQQFPPSTKKESVEQQKYYGTVENENHYNASHNYKNTFAKPNEGAAIYIDCDERTESYSSSQKIECDLSGGGYKEQNYKRSFPARKK